MGTLERNTQRVFDIKPKKEAGKEFVPKTHGI